MLAAVLWLPCLPWGRQPARSVLRGGCRTDVQRPDLGLQGAVGIGLVLLRQAAGPFQPACSKPRHRCPLPPQVKTKGTQDTNPAGAEPSTASRGCYSHGTVHTALNPQRAGGQQRCGGKGGGRCKKPGQAGQPGGAAAAGRGAAGGFALCSPGCCKFWRDRDPPPPRPTCSRARALTCPACSASCTASSAHSRHGSAAAAPPGCMLAWALHRHCHCRRRLSPPLPPRASAASPSPPGGPSRAWLCPARPPLPAPLGSRPARPHTRGSSCLPNSRTLAVTSQGWQHLAPSPLVGPASPLSWAGCGTRLFPQASRRAVTWAPQPPPGKALGNRSPHVQALT